MYKETLDNQQPFMNIDERTEQENTKQQPITPVRMVANRDQSLHLLRVRPTLCPKIVFLCISHPSCIHAHLATTLFCDVRE